MSADARSANLRVGVPQVDQLFAGGDTTLDLAASREGMEAPIRIGTLDLDAPGLDVAANGQVLGGASDLTLDATLADLGAFVPGLNGALRVQGDAGQDGENITLDIGLDGPQGTNAQIGGSVAQSFDRADLSVTGSAPLALANPFISPRSLTGTARFDLGLDGPLAPTSLTGTVTLADGRVVDPTLPAVLNNVNGTARMEGDQVQLAITAAKEAGGQIRFSGPISLQPGYSADIGIELGNVVFEDPRLYRTTLDGQVGIAGPLTGGATIGGTIRLGETELRVPSTGLGATGPIPDGLVHRNEPQAVYLTRRRAGLVEEAEPGSSEDGGGGVAFPLDLTILAENRIFIRGRGLDAELGGELNIGGTTANVVPSGPVRPDPRPARPARAAHHADRGQRHPAGRFRSGDPPRRRDRHRRGDGLHHRVAGRRRSPRSSSAARPNCRRTRSWRGCSSASPSTRSRPSRRRSSPPPWPPSPGAAAAA